MYGATLIVLIVDSSVIAETLKINKYRVHIAVISKEMLEYIILMFVDDADFPIMALYEEEQIDAISTRHEYLIKKWLGDLRAKYGALKPGKYFWFPIHCQWKLDVCL